MDKQIRDKYLTEATGECWHELSHEKPGPCGSLKVCKCGKENYMFPCDNICFSTWQGFGKLWEWAQKQEWFRDFGAHVYCHVPTGKQPPWALTAMEYFIDPDRFADAVYCYLAK